MNKASYKGNYIVSGGFDVAHQGGDYYTTTYSKGKDGQPWYFEFNPSAEYFVNNGLAVGGTFIYAYNSLGADSTQRIAFGPKVSLYWNTIKDIIPFASLDLLYDNNLIYNGTDKSNHWDYSGYTGIFSIGAVFMASDQVGFYASANSEFLSRRVEKISAAGEDQTESKFGWTTGIQLGVKYFIF